ncbi:GNAT family N-acetyltransferase [Herbaspirillum rubrisubalbicans]|nr:GNAT family N-acetyltransferase [Herbaspirillum rubrisubalbicans]
MNIRPSEPRDLPFLRDLFLRSRRATFHWTSPSFFSLADFDMETEGEQHLVALYNEQPVGFVSVWQPSNFIHHLHVDPNYLRRGIGKALLSALPGWKRSCYQLKCVSANSGALVFYLAHGFTKVGEGYADHQHYQLLESSGFESS